MAFLAETKVPSKGRPILGLVGTRIKFYMPPDCMPRALLTYHDTLLVEWQPHKTFFSNGGYMTKTTKHRLNAYLPPTYYIKQEQGKWFLTNLPESVHEELMPDFTIAFTHDGQLEWID
tara:strand:+ start:628 stop:981 length:354 start_codon:yes stop_codon:yes gene_type:complete